MVESAVYLRGAVKVFGGACNGGDSVGGTSVLRGLDMTVPRGSIYGLLGASGCGKTTLLRCALGRVRLDAGEARVLGLPPGAVDAVRVGYMPQDAALLGEFTVADVLLYYGRLLEMQRAAVEERMDLLVPLLQLPPDDRLVKTLSGGQQRRVSLAAAIVHAPELLILDEPTVGLDPLLRHSIWEYLTKLTEGGKTTVIITTHYVEEAQQAHIVGLMRHGKLLAEDAPQHLISLYDCITLEEVFLGMSVQQDQEIQDPSSIENAPSHSKQNKTKSESQEEICMDNPLRDNTEKVPVRQKKKWTKSRCSQSLTKHRLKALLCKNFLSMGRNPGHIIGIFLFPFLQISLFFLAIGGYPTGINLAVVNDEIVDISNCDEYRDIFNDNSSYCTFNASSCLYLNIIDNSLMNMVFYGKMDEAFASVKSGKAIGVIHFPHNFSSQLEIRLLNGIHTNNDTLQFSEIGITMDMTEQHTATLVKTLLYDKYNTMIKQLSSNCDIDSTVSKLPMQFNEPIYGSKYPRYDIFMLPGVLTSMIYFLATTLTAVIMVRERQEGIWSRDIVAGVTSLELILSHIVTQSIFVALQSVEILLVSIYIYGMECKGNIFLLYTIILLQGFCGLTFGLVVAVLSKSITVAMYMCLGIYVPFINLSGVIWPIEGMPRFLQWVSYTMPTTLATISTNNVLQKAWGFFHPQVLHGILTTVLWIIGQVIFAVCVLRQLNISGNKI
ncbi:hypothetical protein R5R35_000907 [Gryllus longicercus]|uniref:ABC transporter domain-containing protein n=1 Tax=Gryllus longicercus TaxID=2509291 RepID=A0AAN9Z1P4_9ORTH